MVQIFILVIGAVLASELVRFGAKRWVGGRVSGVAGPAVALLLLLSALRHPRFGWTEAPMGARDVVVIAGVSIPVAALSQFARERLVRRVLEPPASE